MELNIIGKELRDIILDIEVFENDTQYINAVKFIFKDLVIDITVDIDTAEVLLMCSNLQKSHPLFNLPININSKYIDLLNKPIVSYWNCYNHMGYNDVFILGIDAYVPTLIISCTNSELEITFSSPQLNK